MEEAKAAALGQAWEGPGEGGKQRRRVTRRGKEGDTEEKGMGGEGLGRGWGGWASPKEAPGGPPPGWGTAFISEDNYIFPNIFEFPYRFLNVNHLAF